MPPRFHLDGDGFGDEALLMAVKRVRPLVHVFEHAHEGYGREEVGFGEFEEGMRGFRGVKMVWTLLVGERGGRWRPQRRRW